jgi:hypothetical protein
MLDNIEKRQKEMYKFLLVIEEELGADTSSKYRSDNSISMQIQSCRNIRKEINSEDQRYSGYQDEDPSNQQLRNIFFNLDSVENEIRRLNHVLDHFFGKIGN